MRGIACALLITSVGCGSAFEVPPLPDAHMTLDLATSSNPAPVDMTCFNTACGGCSAWAKYDGTPAQEGDPCLWNGVYQCNGTSLACSSSTCPSCSGKAVGSICGADGHTILELNYAVGTCAAYDFGSAINVCNHSSSDGCVARCSTNASTGEVDCVAHCLSDDGGATGCQHMSTETCDTLKSC